MTYVIKKEWRIFKHRLKFEWRSKKSFMGRFGGGWNWEIGVQASRSCVLFNLLVCMLRFDRNWYAKRDS